MTSIKLTFTADDGHGYLAVPPDVLALAGLRPTHFSRYSFISPLGTVHLEEDLDAPRLLGALKAHGVEVSIVTRVVATAHCRSYDRIGERSALTPAWRA